MTTPEKDLNEPFAMPAWALDNLYVDECALLSGGVDWSNPVHVLLLRLAYERRGHHSARHQLSELQGPDYGKPTEEEMQRVVAQFKDRDIIPRDPRCAAGEHVWGPPTMETPTVPRHFPMVYCERCRCATRFTGTL